MFARNKQGEWRVSPAAYKLLLTTHIIVSVGWLGVVVAKLLLGLIAATTNSPDAALLLFAAAERLNIAFPPLAIGTLATGVLLSLGTKWGLIQHYWVATKLLLTIGVIVTAVQVGSRLARRVSAAPVEQAAPGDTLLDLVALPVRLLLALSAVHLLLLGVATVLSVYKPWGKTRFALRKALPLPRRA